MLKKEIKLIVIISFLFVLNACEKKIKPSIIQKKNPANIVEPKIKKVTFLIENSESMFGYVHEYSEYVDVLTELSQKAQFARENTHRQFNFINGDVPLKITSIGNNPLDLTNKLNSKGFSCGDITKSNLNTMFQVALNKAQGDSISILISDGIYDVSNTPEPLNAIGNLGKNTRTEFIKKLGNSDIQTIMIKLNSDFDGNYFFISRNGKEKITQKRPYYIWIFGESKLLNKYFPEEYVSTKLNGYDSMMRFLKIGESDIPYQVVSHNKKGSFKFDSDDKNVLENVKPDLKTKEFRFSIALDFSSLPFSDSYFNSIKNYDIDGNFKILSIERIDKIAKKMHGLKFKPTHVITVSTIKSPYGKLRIGLRNTIPDWIEETNIDDDTNIKNNTSQTIGFKYLTKGITDAYQEFTINEGRITTLKIEIKK